jgi:hypothetical protein
VVGDAPQPPTQGSNVVSQNDAAEATQAKTP